MNEGTSNGRYRHGASTPGTVTHSAYRAWADMKQRCGNRQNDWFHAYGARGIKVCARWLKGFEFFLADMGPAPAGLTLDRINNNGDYEPGNCRWATPREQMNNRRYNRVLRFRGAAMSVAQWAERVGINQKTISGRLRRGWPVRRALTVNP